MPAALLIAWSPNRALTHTRLMPLRGFRNGMLVLSFLFWMAQSPLAGAQPSLHSAISNKNYYVSETGNDTNNGSRAHPWRTIQHANKMVKPGVTVHVLAGLYTGIASDSDYGSYITTTTSGTPDAWITYVAEPRWGARILVQGNGEMCLENPNKEACNGGTLWANTANFIIIRDFDIAGLGTVTHGIVNYVSNVKIIGNKIHDIPAPNKFGAGVNSTSCRLQTQVDMHGWPCGNVWAIGNMIYNIGTAAGSVSPTSGLIEGIYFSAPHENVVNNIVFDISNGWCIDLNHFDAQSIVTNNTIYNCGKLENGNYFGGGINISSEEDFAVVDYVTVTNNIVANIHGQAGIMERIAGGGRLGPHNFFSHNLLFKVDSGQNVQTCWSPPSAGSGHCTNRLPAGSVVADPQFAVEGVDFHVKPGSPAIGAGTTDCALNVSGCVPETDFDGQKRPVRASSASAESPGLGAGRATRAPQTAGQPTPPGPSIGAYEPGAPLPAAHASR